VVIWSSIHQLCGSGWRLAEDPSQMVVIQR
jgi:hypothetical protein